MKTCTLSHLRQNIYTLFEDIEGGQKMLVVRSGKVIGVIVPFQDAEDEVQQDINDSLVTELRSRAKSGKKDFMTMKAFEKALPWNKHV